MHLSVNGYLDFSISWVIVNIMNNATMNMQISVQGTDLISFEETLRSGIAESYNNSIYNFLRTLQTVFIVAIPVYIPIKDVQKSLVSESLLILIISYFLMIAILIGVKWYYCFGLHFPGDLYIYILWINIFSGPWYIF